MMDHYKSIADFKENGFCSVGALIDKQDIEVLRIQGRKMLLDQPKFSYSERNKMKDGMRYRQPVLVDDHWQALINIIGLSPRVDSIMESLFNNPTFKTIMESTIGSGYKMSTCSLRLSTGSDDGLGFHTDGMGENGVSILLDDQYISQEGVTAVLRGSHKWPVSSQEVMFDSIPVKLLQPFCTPLTGKKGDIFLFTNKTYHGRIPNHSGNTKLVMLIGFFSVGYEFYRFNVPQSILKNIGPELNRLMDGSNFKPINENGLCQVQSFDGSFPDFIDSLYTRNKSRSLIWSVVRIYPILIVGPIQWLKNKIKSIPT